MQSVLNVLSNRAKKHGTTIYIEATKRLQFSSLTAPGDPQLVVWPADGDPDMATALAMAGDAVNGTLVDITDGATLYYAPAGIHSSVMRQMPNGDVVKFPEDWNPAAVTFTVTIADQYFFREQ